MQTTLLSLAILIILALLAALVGPLFIDWGTYRGEFERRASLLTGLEFRVTGPIDARLLPTPTLKLQGIEFSRPGDSSKVRARALHLEFALGALLRGEWRIEDARLEAPQLSIGLDDAGRVVWPVPSIGFAPEGVSIQRLEIEGGQAVLEHAGSGSRVALDKIEFKGELRSLAGPVKGEGAFTVSGQHYPYRIAMSRVADDGGVKVRLNIDPIDRPFNAEADVSIWVEGGAPRFEGSVALSRPVGRAPAGGRALIIEPWRVTSRLKGDSDAAVLEQIEFQYGAEDRAIKLRGDAKLTFGSEPQLVGVLSSPQLDLDRMLALPEETRRRPPIAIKALADSFSGAHGLPIPIKLGLSIETLILAGATLQRVSGEVRTAGESWDIQSLDLRAPGFTQVRLSGRFGTSPKGVTFTGPAKIDSGDPRAFLAWLSDRPDPPVVGAGSLRVSGDVALGADAISIDRLSADVDRMTVLGRFRYSRTSGDRPARLDAALTAPEIDFDRVHALAKSILGDTELDRPREGSLSLKVDRALVAGIEAKGADISMQLDASGLAIDRLTIADFGGALLAVKGRIDTRARSPRGALAIELDARALNGIIALLDKFAPASADQLRRSAQRVTPAKLRAEISVESGAAGSAYAAARFKVDGRAGSFRLALSGGVGAASDAFTVENLAALGTARLKLAGSIDTDEGGALAELFGLEHLIATDKRPGRLKLNAYGALGGNVVVDGELSAGPLKISTSGMVRLSNERSPTARLELKVANANIRSPRPASAGAPAELLPTSLTARLALTEGTLSLMDVIGSVAGTRVGGRLDIGLRRPVRVDGDVDLGALDLATAMAVATGASAPHSSTTLWSAEPFGPSLQAGWSGQIAIKSDRVTLTPKLAARDLRAVLKLDGPELAVENIDGAFAGGRIGGSIVLLPGVDGLTARARVRLAGVSLPELLPGEGPPALTGRVTLELAGEGTGRSPSALIGSFGGNGTFTLEKGRIAGLDPAAFVAVVRAVDQGLPIETTRIRDRMDAGLAAGHLPITLAEGAITLTAGQTRLSNPVVRAEGADLTIGGILDLADGGLDARLILTGVAGGATTGGRPEVLISLKGPIGAPKRATDVTALASWLALRAVEQQSKKLDALEARESTPDSATIGAAAPTSPLPAATSMPPPSAASPVDEAPIPLPRPTAPSTPPAAIAAPPPPASPPSASRRTPRPSEARQGAGSRQSRAPASETAESPAEREPPPSSPPVRARSWSDHSVH